jgi:hypothetical protein
MISHLWRLSGGRGSPTLLNSDPSLLGKKEKEEGKGSLKLKMGSKLHLSLQINKAHVPHFSTSLLPSGPISLVGV